MMQGNPLYHSRMRLAFRELVEFLEFFGWSCEEVKEKNFPYCTKYWMLRPNENEHKDSDCIKKFLYACDYYDIHINYKCKYIAVYV